MKYAHYDETNGKLLGWYDDEIHATISIPNIEVSEEDWQTAISNAYNYVDATTKTLSYKDFRTFTELQTAKIQEIVTAYNNANQLKIDYMDTTFQADKKSQDLIVSVLSAGSVPSDFFWLDASNNQVPMTYVELQGLSGAILARNQANFVKYQTLKSQIKSVTTQSELDAIIW